MNVFNEYESSFESSVADFEADRTASPVAHRASYFGANLALAYPDYYDAFIGTGQHIDDVLNEKLFVMKNATHGLLESRSEEFSGYIHEIAKILSDL